MAASRTLSAAVEFGRTAGDYQRLRAAAPFLPARDVLLFVRTQDSTVETFDQFICGRTDRGDGIGHSWPPMETRGALRCYYCGLDGDA